MLKGSTPLDLEGRRGLNLVQADYCRLIVKRATCLGWKVERGYIVYSRGGMPIIKFKGGHLERGTMFKESVGSA